MLKKAITYTDLSGDEATEIFYFNLSKSEIIEWEVEYDEGLAQMMERIVKTTDRHGLVTIFKDLILRCYGQKSEDGKRFIKNEQLSEEFSQMPAYDVLFMQLATDAEEAALFVVGILPKDLTEGVDIKQLVAEQLGTIQSNVETAVQEAGVTPEVSAAGGSGGSSASTGPTPPTSPAPPNS